MTKSYLDGEIECIDYALDLPYEVKNRYNKMAREHREYAELIYDCLLSEGAAQYDSLTDSQFKKLIRKQYKYISEVFEDVAYNLKSKKYIECLKNQAEKYPSLDIKDCIKVAEEYL